MGKTKSFKKFANRLGKAVLSLPTTAVGVGLTGAGYVLSGTGAIMDATLGTELNAVLSVPKKAGINLMMTGADMGVYAATGNTIFKGRSYKFMK